MNILITGGLGYIGSQCVLELSKNGYNPIIIDNCVTSSIATHKKIITLSGSDIKFIRCDLTQYDNLENSLLNIDFDTVIHLAGYKSIQESMINPLKYYYNNIISTQNILRVMEVKNVKSFIFSSSATVYGVPSKLPLDENHELNPINVYGRTKQIIEKMLIDISNSRKDFKAVSLRYFNPLGSYLSGELGEDPIFNSGNLASQILEVLFEKQSKLSIYGTNFDTSDGSAIRDFIHVSDLAKGHLAAYNWLKNNRGFNVFNLGTGKGTSVFEIISKFESVANKKIKLDLLGMRAGEVPIYFCSTKKVYEKLNWKAQYDIKKMVEDCYLWACKLNR